MKHYLFTLKLILDNDYTEEGAFSIQNVAKMGFCHNKLPGEWYGPHAITIMLRVNNIYYCLNMTKGLEQAVLASKGLSDMCIS